MFQQDGSLTKKCVTCGSSTHLSKECTRPGGTKDPKRDEHWQQYRQRRQESTSSQAAGEDQDKGKGKRGRGKGKGKGKGKAAAADAQTQQPPPSPPVPPTTQATASVVISSQSAGAGADADAARRVPRGGSLLDSGANVRLKYVKHLSSIHPVLPMIIADGSTVFGSSYEGEK